MTVAFRAFGMAFVVALVSAVGVPGSSVAQPPASQTPPTLPGDMLRDWESLKNTMMQLGDAMPEDKFGFKPTPELRTYAEQLLHVAGTNVMLIKLLDPTAAAPTLPEKATAKADVMKALGDSFDFGTPIIKSQTTASLQEVVQNAPRFLGPSTRARIIYRLMTHTWDEYGAMTVYLRLNGIVPPASRR